MYPPLNNTIPLYDLFEEKCSPIWEIDGPQNIDYDRMNESKCARMFLDALAPRRVIVFERIFYILNKFGHYISCSERNMSQLIMSSDHRASLSPQKVHSIVRTIRTLCDSTVGPGHWLVPGDDKPDTTNFMFFENGYYDPETRNFTPYDGAIFAADPPKFDYDPTVACPTWTSFLRDALSEGDRKSLHEFLGLVMTRNTSYHVILLLIGVPRSGKSTIVNIGKELAGHNNSVTRVMRDLTKSSALAGLVGKTLLDVPDAHDIDDRNHNGALNVLKAIAGEDETSYHVLYEGFDAARMHVRIILAANMHPHFIDISGGLLSRELILTFAESALGREDRHLFSKLRNELSGIANHCIKGFHRLKENGQFTRSDESVEAAATVAQYQTPLKTFINEYLDITAKQTDFVPDWKLHRELGYFQDAYNAKKAIKSVSHLKDLLVAEMPLEIRKTQRRRKSWETGTDVTNHGLSGVRIKE